jgi:4-hydroxy-3-polyprenylbenzoate decarboxylase
MKSDHEFEMTGDDDKPDSVKLSDALTRRGFLASSGGLASLGLGLLSHPGTPAHGKTPALPAPQPPYDSIRDWVAALEAHGLLIRMGDVDQDEFHVTGLFFNLTDEYTWWGAPAMLFDRVKIDGKWVEGPLLANLQGHLSTDSILWGLETRPGDAKGNYRRAKAHMRKVFRENGNAWPSIDPREIPSAEAPCKEVILRGDEIDLTKFAFIQTNPADGGRYVNSGSVFTEDPEIGRNFGTYRCQIKGPRKLALNPETNQGGWRMITAARERGEKVCKVAVVVGQDPLVFMISSTKMTGFSRKGPIADELALAGGLRGKPLEVVKCETNDMRVPAHAEMVIEGEVLFDEPLEPEGPFGEMYGYLGPRDEGKFWMRVTTVTHRRQPWILNMFTGMERGLVTAPMHTLIEHGLRERFPYFVEYYHPHDTMGITYLAIKKTKPGQGLEIGSAVAGFDPIAKITVVLDDDVDLLSAQDIQRAIVARWQPYPATHIIEHGRGIIIDPSQREKRKTSKIAIDATRQWPEEGGPDVFAGNSRDLLNELQPDAIADSAQRFAKMLNGWKKV